LTKSYKKQAQLAQPREERSFSRMAISTKRWLVSNREPMASFISKKFAISYLRVFLSGNNTFGLAYTSCTLDTFEAFGYAKHVFGQ
jgi:hypothetical protein